MDYSVVILGGGPAGCACALALQQLGVKRILLVEAGAYDKDRIGECVPPGIRKPLEKLQLWSDFLQEKHEPNLGNCSAWGTETLAYNDYVMGMHGYGWHLDRRRFDAFLAEKVREKGIVLQTGWTFVRSAPSAGNGFTLNLNDTQGSVLTVTTAFVVDATGRHSAFARAQGALRLFHDRLICVSGLFEAPDNFTMPGFTLLEAAEYGWWYAAALPGRRMILALSTDPEILKTNNLRDESTWLDAAGNTRHAAPALQVCRFVPGSLQAWAAPSFVLDTPAGQHWLALGDAASAYDPISSHGIYKALDNGLSAAKAIADWLAGDATAPARYADTINQQFQQYLDTRNYFYAAEQRWPDAFFWNRRRSRNTVGEALTT